MHIRAIRGSFRRRVWHSCHTHATLLGGAAVPAAPTKHSCTNINYPTEFTEFTEASGRGYSPTDFTDAHRWLGCVGFSHRIHRSFWQRIFSHRFHRCSQIWRVWHPAIPTQPSANSPTEFTEFTEVSGARYSPTDFTDAHRWLGCVGFCGFCGKIV